MNVFIAEGIHPSGLDILKEAGIQIFESSDTFDPEIIAGIIVRSVYQINATTMKDFINLRVAAKLGTGIDNIDQCFCEREGIDVINAPGMNAISTAEFIVMQILNIYKNNFAITDAVKSRDFRRKLYFGRELSDKCVGVIGYGSVGKIVSEMMLPFVEKVNVYTRTQKCELNIQNLHFVATQEELLKGADIVVLATSLKGNEGMVDLSFLKLLKHNALFVNMARGGLVDEQTLVSFLQNNDQVVYCCDVLTNEPDYTLSSEDQNYQNSLLNLPNVIYTPHIAGMTDECQKRIAINIAQKVSRKVLQKIKL